eukprot:6893512-Lingulodinium_polyedra.AAC.1
MRRACVGHLRVGARCATAHCLSTEKRVRVQRGLSPTCRFAGRYAAPLPAPATPPKAQCILQSPGPEHRCP